MCIVVFFIEMYKKKSTLILVRHLFTLCNRKMGHTYDATCFSPSNIVYFWLNMTFKESLIETFNDGLLLLIYTIFYVTRALLLSAHTDARAFVRLFLHM